MLERYLELLDNFKEKDIANFLKNLRGKILVSLKGPYFSEKIKPFFTAINAEGEPFSNFEHEPKQVVQIKQVVNALYHAQLAFEDLQSLNLRYSDKKQLLQVLSKLYYKTIEHGYKASYLLTHLDIDFNEVLGSELQHVIQLLAPIKAYADAHKNGAIELTSTLKDYPIGRTAGLISGIAIAQMKPNEGNFDYDFLAHFGAVLPGYIQQLTVYLQTYAPQISTYQPTIDKAKLDELQENAFYLLKSIENLQSGDIFLSFRALNYIRIIREIITLSMSSLQQIGYANDSSQQVIRHNMGRLKYELLPRLFSLADRLEDQALLAPGTLSKPMMTHIKPFYKLLGIYVSKIVDFSKEGAELLSIEDALFTDLRLEPIRQRIATEKWNLTKQQFAVQAFTKFFAIIEDTQYAQYSLLNLPLDVKEQLKNEFKYLLPYAKTIDPELTNLIIANLVDTNGVFRYLTSAWHLLSRQTDSVALTGLAEFKEKLQTALSKDVVTQEFHIKLNQDIIDSVETQADINVFPYKNRMPLVTHNDALALGIDPAKAHIVLQSSRGAESIWISSQAALAIENAQYAQYSLSNLPPDVKEKLKNELKNLLPYAETIDPELTNLIIANLIDNNGVFRQLASAWRGLNNQTDSVVLTRLADFKKILQAALKKDVATQEFHLKLNQDTDGFAKVQFAKDAENTWVSNQASLTLEQTNTLDQYYQSKYAKIIEAQIALQEFLDILAEPGQKPLAEIKDSDVKKQLRRLYSQFQPYLVEKMPSRKKAEQQDRAIVDMLSEKPYIDEEDNKEDEKEKETKEEVLIDCFDTNNTDALFGLFTSLAEFYKVKAEEYQELAKQKYVTHIKEQVLTPDNSGGSRASYLIKHTNYSKAIAAYRASLTQLTSVFNQTVRDKLLPAWKGVPFPEMENKNTALVESRQVAVLKRIFNSLYHLEHICIQLEKLDQKSTQIFYVYHLVQAKGHVDELFELAKDLAVDPHLSLLAEELKSKALVIYQAFIEQKENYVVGSEEVKLEQPQFQDKTVKYSGLWHALHAFALIPEHIKAATGGNSLSKETKDTVNKYAKQATLNIERIVENSNSYFKLLLETPTMYRLYKELKRKLNEFTKLSHEAALAHLEDLNNDLFVRILIETDAWEDKLGLAPGLLSDPMKSILDEFHQAFLESLGLSSQEHIALVSTLAPITYRAEAARRRSEKIKAQMFPTDSKDPRLTIKVEELNTDKYDPAKATLTDKYALVSALKAEIDSYTTAAAHLPTSLLESNKERLLRLYEAALPIIREEKKHLRVPDAGATEGKYKEVENILQTFQVPFVTTETPSTHTKGAREDTSEKETIITQEKTESTLSEPEKSIPEAQSPKTEPVSQETPVTTEAKKTPQTANVIQMITTVLNYYQGCNNSLQFEINAVKERSTYLNKVKENQENASAKFIDDYTEKAFARELKLATSRYIGLLHTRDEYNNTLKDFLQTKSLAIIEQAKVAQDIDATIKSLLSAEVRTFDRRNFSKYSHLEAVRTVLAEFDGYFGKVNQSIQRGTSFFESARTLANKVEIIDNLKRIAHSEQTVEKRLEDIATEVKKGSFKATMLAYHHYNTLSFAWIAQCIMSLLSALHLYTPKYKVLAQKLETAAKAPTESYSLPRRYTLFAPEAARSYDLPEPVVPDSNERPVVAVP
ncbi:hypothetical protein [Legionella cardiaca]|uniref:SdhA, substrate of the Dot/Icm system n=1 Tax=Legionella cardiaca TaxID=1071983 RepID=A0ABY8AVJ8_9GAMM|nr:hypothetical protein [Legionella cardiaca]WED43197.1 hypothetical protein PXX05_00020 [Legionella cardiaca]